MIKFVVLFALLLLVFCTVIAYVVYKSLTSMIIETKNEAVYAARYNPGNNRYYIVEVRGDKEKAFRTWYGRKRYYLNNNQAEIVLQKLRGNFA